MHIILCSDSPAVRDVVYRSLADPDDHLTVCESGMELLATVKAIVSDLVILDLESHGLGGLLLVSAVRELAPGLRILAVSMRSEVDARSLVQMGVPYVRLGADGADGDEGGTRLLAEHLEGSGAALSTGSR